MRNFIRHASDIPLNVHIETDAQSHPHHSLNISEGGLSFIAEQSIPVGKMVSITVPSISSHFKFKGEVVWCRKIGKNFTIGIQFHNSEENFTARMVEQICHIESYRQYILKKEGRSLNSDEAAEEWIKKYADKFPDIYLRYANRKATSISLNF